MAAAIGLHETLSADELQGRAIDRTYDSIKAGRDVLVEAPTGTGKTRIFSKLTEELLAANKRTLVLAHFKEIITQNHEAFGRWTGKGDETTLNMDGKLEQGKPVVFSTAKTALKFAKELKNFDAVIIDEAHHAHEGHQEYKQLLDMIGRLNPNMQVVGVTATPPEQREGMHPRLKNAEHVVITFEEAEAAKLIDLPETRIARVPLQNGARYEDIITRHQRGRSEAEMIAGASSEIQKNLPENIASVRADIHMDNMADRKRIMSFFASIKECDDFAQELKKRGEKVEVVHSGTSEGRAALQRFREGKTTHVASVDQLVEGVDVPDSDAVANYNMLVSRKKYRQMIGRGARACGANKERKTLFLDAGISTDIHGEIGAQARVQTLRGALDQKVIGNDDLLPGKSKASDALWVKLPVVRAGMPQIYATAIEDRVIYTAETDKGYVTIEAHDVKKGKVKTPTLEVMKHGEPRKRIAADPAEFASWVGDRVRANEETLSRLMSPDATGKVSKLEALIARDFAINGDRVMRNIETLTTPVQAAAVDIGQARQAHFARQAAFGRGAYS